MIGIKLDTRLGLAVFVGGLVHHVYLLLATNAREMAIITHSDEQPSTIGIGKCRHRLSQFAGISHTVFEVLLLMLAFANHVEKITFIVHTGAKIRKKRQKNEKMSI
jgi:hypothetical protein